MAVYTTKFDWFSIEIEILPGEAEFIFFSRSLFNAYFPEANKVSESELGMYMLGAKHQTAEEIGGALND